MHDGAAMAQPLGMDSPQRPVPRPVMAFLVLGIAAGTCFALWTPPHDAPDEPRHLQRVWLLSEGSIALPGPGPGEGGAVPESLYALHSRYQRGTVSCRHDPQEILAALQTPLAPERRRDHIRTPILYGPAGYLFPALVVAPARGLGASAGGLFYLARLANLAAWGALCGLAIAIAPARRWVLVAVALLPMSLFEASTISADAATNALALVLLAWTLRLSVPSDGLVAARERYGYVALVALLGLAKPGYSLLALLALGVPAVRLGGPRRRWGFVALATLAGLVFPLGWGLALQLAGPFPFPRADPSGQLAGIPREPVRFVSAVGLTLIDRAADFARSAVGVMGRLDVRLPPVAYAAYGVLLLVASVAEDREAPRLPGVTRAVLASVALLGVLAIPALLYVSATPLGAGRVIGIQGRYFLPFLPLVLAALPVVFDGGGTRRWGILCASGTGLALAMAAIWQRYYGL